MTLTVKDLETIVDYIVINADLDLNYTSWECVKQYEDHELHKWPYDEKKEALILRRICMKLDKYISEIKPLKQVHVQCIIENKSICEILRDD